MIAPAQPWSAIIAASRATDWSSAGATIVNRTRQCGATIAAYSGTAAKINNAISACPADRFVQLGAGTFNLSTEIQLSKSNVTLRGMGADQTNLNFTGTSGNSACAIGENRVVSLCTGGRNIAVADPEHTATWTAGYGKGTTVVTLSRTRGLEVGSTLWLDQVNDASDGFPAAGDLWICSGEAGCSNQGGGESFARAGRGQVEGQVVTAINGSNVTIAPGLRMPNYGAARSPGAWWGNATTILKNTGLENLTVDLTNSGGASGIYVVNATNCWVSGVRVVKADTGGSNIRQLSTINALNVTVKDSYFYGPPTTQLVSVYGISLHVTSSSLLQNNILHKNSAPIVPNSAYYGNVLGYNYVDAGLGASVVLHGVGAMNLYEGNNWGAFSGDVIHASHAFETLFRNHHDGREHNPNDTEASAAISLYSKNRFFNIIGNVLGTPHWTSYQSSQAHHQHAIYEFGWQGTGSGNPVPSDAHVLRTVLRWGNWDNVNSATRFLASEVPSGIPSFPNPVPASQALPTSFYLGRQPAWWTTPFGTPPWPPIGPDVAGGNISTSPTGGHANKIPARLCFENSGLDPAYPSSNPRIKLFGASSCYPRSGDGL